jgi:hypothetical protein
MTNPSSPQPVPFDSGRWQWEAAAHRVEEHLGRKSLYLENGVAWIADARFTNGSIEFDMAFPARRGFMGGVWRVQDSSNYEEFYVRPHQSGNPDATQYTPVFHGMSGWQLYHGERFSVPVTHRFEEWVHVKILFSGAQAEIYLGDMEKPALFVEELKHSVGPGSVGVSVGGVSSAHFSNFSYTVTDSPPIQGRPGKPDPVPAGVITSWWVSDVFPESALQGKAVLAREDLAARTWTRLATEGSGLANLARVQGATLRKNTVLAKKVILSDQAQIKRLDFGFSDKIAVYLNGRLLFRGDDTYRSRDYRFLGSIGYFDALYLPLAKGENELLMAVSEDAVQGGWGVQAKLEDLGGLQLAD